MYTGGIVTYSRQQPTFRVVMLVVLITAALLITLFVPLSALPTAANVPSGHAGCAYHPGQTVIADCAQAIKVQSCSGLHDTSFQVFLSGIVSLHLAQVQNQGSRCSFVSAPGAPRSISASPAVSPQPRSK